MIRDKVRKRMKQRFADQLRGENSYARGALAKGYLHYIEEEGVRYVYGMLSHRSLAFISMESDYALSMDDLKGDCYDEVNAQYLSGGLRTLRAQEKEFERLVDDEGVWYVVSKVCKDAQSEFEVADSIGGILGMDEDHNGYAHDLRSAAVDMFLEMKGLPSWSDIHPDPKLRANVVLCTLMLLGMEVTNRELERSLWTAP